MSAKEARIETLRSKIATAEAKGLGTSGCVRKWKRELRKLGAE